MVLVAHRRGDVDKPGRRALVVPRVAGPPERVDHGLAIRVEHGMGSAQIFAEDLAGRPHRDGGVDRLAGKHAQHQQLEQRHGLVVELDSGLVGVGGAGVVQQPTRECFGPQLAHGSWLPGRRCSESLFRWQALREVDAAVDPRRELAFGFQAVAMTRGASRGSPDRPSPSARRDRASAARSVSSGGTRTINPPLGS